LIKSFWYRTDAIQKFTLTPATHFKRRKQKALTGKNTGKGLSNCGFRLVVFKGYRSVSKDRGCFHRVRIHLLDWILGVGLFVMTEQK